MAKKAKRPKHPKRLVSYRALEVDPSYEHAVDQAVRIRVGRRDLQRIAADSSTAIVKALGKRHRKLWFVYERAADEMRARREAAYFDVGVEHGVAAERADSVRVQQRHVQRLAGRLTREALREGLAQEDTAAAAVMTAWALVGGKLSREAKRPSR